MKQKGLIRTFSFKGLQFPAREIDADRSVKFLSTTADLVGAERGNSSYCRVSKGILRNATSGVFPHPVLAVKTTRCVVHILASNARKLRNGNGIKLPTVFRYLHEHSGQTKKVDRNEPVVAEMTIRLAAPDPSHRLGLHRVRGPTTHGNHRPSSERIAKPRVCGNRGLGLNGHLSGREMDLEEYEKEKKGPKLYTGKG